MAAVSSGIVQEEQPFDVAWRTIDGLRIRYATNERGGEKVVLFSPWPESIFRGYAFHNSYATTISRPTKAIG
jgi:hypothetical protein